MSRRSPVRIGPYRIEARLGEGGMGTVHRARDPEGREVALKVLRAAIRTEALIARFQREARIRIAHPNLARVLDAGVDDEGTPFLALELLAGETLADRFARGRPAMADLVRVGRDVCAGLSAAHAHKVIHRDIKPSNIFLCENGTVKVLDFGVALLDDGRTRLTEPGAVPGTVGYLSPEQAKGEVAVDARSDLWSLGAVLYEGVTGRIPFERPTPLATLVATLMAPLVPVRELRRDAPPELAEAIERTLCRDPDARYGSAEALREALASADLSKAGGAPRTHEAPPSIPPGERRVLALLFAEGLHDPHAFEDAVRAHGGTSLRLVGNRGIGLFGVSRWEGREVQRAAQAALAIRPAADRVALSSGWAASGGTGVTGEALEAAERCARAPLEGVAVDSEAARALRDTAPLVEIASGLFELRTTTPFGSAAAAANSLETVGRDAEMAQLTAALRSVLVDRVALVTLLVGPAGIGKSRLRAELERSLRGQSTDALVLSVVVDPGSREKDLALARTLTLAAAGIEGAAREDDLRAALEESLSRVVDRKLVKPHVDALAALLSGNAGRPSTAEVDFRAVQDRSRVALLDWLSGLADTRPLVVLVEDMQWADEASLEILEDLIDEAAERPLFLCGLARPELLEREPAPFAGREVVVIEPRGLTHADVGVLASRIAGRSLDDSVLQAIAQRSGGNPFFVVQLVRALADAGLLAEPAASLPLPRTVEATVQSRLDHLPSEERNLCRRVSVWARAFTHEEAGALGGEIPEARLASLVARDLFSRRGRRSTPTFHFKSPLVLEVAYRSLDTDFRRTLHRRAAAHLAGTPGRDPEERARHHERGHEHDEAAVAYGLAARVAVRRGDTQSALRCAERALSLGGPDAARFELHALRVDALRFLGHGEEQTEALEAALSAATEGRERSRILGDRAVWLSRRGRAEEALASAREAETTARASGDREAQILAFGRHSLVLHHVGRAQEAGVALEEALRLSAGAPLPLRALVLGWRGIDVALRGSLEARLQVFAELAEVCEELGDLRRAAGAHANLADAYNRLGMYAEAESALEEALTSCRRVKHQAMEGYVLLNLSYARVALGDVDAALAHLDDAAHLAGATAEARLSVLVKIYRARALLLAGQPRAARAECQAALDAEGELAAEQEVTLRTLLARATLRDGNAKAALACSDRAFAAYESLVGMEEDEADVFVSRAEVLRAVDRPDEAEEVLRRGRKRVEALARAIADESLRARFLRDVPAHRALMQDDRER